MDAIYQLSNELTILIIAHRLSTLENCSAIIEITKGKITKKTPDN
jgi:ABC-type multidrug transport system fused ATPase/permease subunit